MCSVDISHSPQSDSKTRFSPWVCHFHVDKEIMKKRSLSIHSIIDDLYKQCKSQTILPNVQFTCVDCSVADNQREKEDTLCVTVTVIEKAKNTSIKLDTIRDLMIPFLLETVLKGLMEIEKVDILWNERPRIQKSRNRSYGELYLRVSMSGRSDKTRLWNLLVDHCLPIMDMIDWTRSHPDNIRDFCLAYGIDAGWEFFLNNLKSAISDVGKSLLPEHLILVANSLSVTGEFVGLNAKGWKRQREHASVLSPFVQACFSSPGSCFIKAAKAGVMDDLRGSLDALAWGKTPPVGTGQFDIVYSGKGFELSKPVDVYDLLGSQMSAEKQKYEFEVPFTLGCKSNKYGPQFVYNTDDYVPKGTLERLRRLLTYNDIHRLSQALSKILNKYPVDQQLNEADKCTLMSALYFHPRRDEKIGSGAQDIKVVNHPDYHGSRCFSVVRTDGTIEDFSYRKCVHGALEIIAPQKARRYHEKHLQSRNP